MTTIEQMETMCAKIESFNEDCFLDALAGHRYGERKIRTMKNRVTREFCTLQDAYLYFVDLSQTYNETFAHYDNHEVDDNYRMLRRLDRSLRETEKLARSFLPSLRKLRRYHSELRNAPIDAFHYSRLFSPECQLGLWGMDQYPAYVVELFQEMDHFMCLLAQSLVLCIKTKQDEEAIRRSPDKCCKLYWQMIDKFIKEWGKQWMQANDCVIPPEKNPLIALRKRCKSEREWAANAYHRCTPTEVRSYYITTERLKHEQDAKLFDGDTEALQRTRRLIACLDEIIDRMEKEKKTHHKKTIREKITGKDMVFVLVSATKSIDNLSLFYRFFCKEYTLSHGKRKLPQLGTFTAQYGKTTGSDEIIREMKRIAAEVLPSAPERALHPLR